jgi:hypothetical protein
MQNGKLEKDVKNRADWEKSLKEAKVCIELYDHLRRIRRIKQTEKIKTMQGLQ